MSKSVLKNRKDQWKINNQVFVCSKEMRVDIFFFFIQNHTRIKMKIQTNFVFLSFFACVIQKEVFSVRKEFIGDCLHTDTIQPNVLTFICFDHFRPINYFEHDHSIECSNSSLANNTSTVGSVNFAGCQMSRIKYNIFDAVKNLNTLNISAIELQYLPKEFFNGAQNLKNLFASKNRLKDIPESQFIYAIQLTKVDFSFNKINNIARDAFSGVKHLEVLNISHNNINMLTSGSFGPLENLKFLDLSFNRILKIDKLAFVPLTNLEFLSLANNQLSCIEQGALIHKNYLEIVHLNNNKLTDLNGLKYSSLPSLYSFVIFGNNFSCDGLQTFFGEIDHENLLSALDHDGSPYFNGTNVHNVSCILKNDNTNNNHNYIHTTEKIEQHEKIIAHDYNLINVSLIVFIFVCIFIGVCFIVIGSERNCTRYGRTI